MQQGQLRNDSRSDRDSMIDDHDKHTGKTTLEVNETQLFNVCIP